MTASQKQQLKQLKKTTSQNSRLGAAVRRQMISSMSETVTGLSTALIQYNQAVKKQMAGIGSNLISTVDSSQDVLGNLKKVKQLNNQSLDTAIQGNRLVATTSGKLENQLLAYKNDIVAISNKLKLTSDDNIADIITVLQSNPDLMGSALAQPFTVKNEDIYKVNSFGAAFAPTYIALSIWVGCTMLVAVLKTKVPKLAKFRGLSVREEYLGKLLTFGTLSLVQTLVILLSAVLILRIHVASFFLLLMVGLLSSMTFTIIVYTMAALFGNLGKAFIVMLMAVQLAGSGAMYPVQLNPLLFRIFQPLFPFAYSVGGFREAIGGANMGTVVIDFFVLICMSLIMLTVGLSTKKPLKKYTDRLLDDFKKTGMG
ncbi:YhgE/Pip family protein [Lentilactobacillus farraginis]|uniref:Phage infection protein n=1 Tax=Lentilactobacillus farraginis DSM 18382 = JCM 14108 TaxID=1423743 RepID=X0PJX2_9LACO|nr:YhgE/Pip domain-containing protein [Lentilactobacillus farraginis]GAF36936.1 phage infection protein [Lentilactobacillus farraginis DSM 18382 = JCM 14108]